ncbi:hypothetical protein AB0M47_06830 [Hamadaea sp. NPDC051192]|uniref:hypothetical protein n=1 Tax=Hamadaea sp. NPDC051192 TaxID=3154940 RepID=UPI00341AF68C
MTGRGVDQILDSPGNPRLWESAIDDARAYVLPGALFSYSNSAYVVLGRLVEVLRGKLVCLAVWAH